MCKARKKKGNERSFFVKKSRLKGKKKKKERENRIVTLIECLQKKKAQDKLQNTQIIGLQYPTCRSYESLSAEKG